MKRLTTIFTLLLCTLIYSCKTTPDERTRTDELKAADGDKFYGGIFKLNEPEYIKNLFPHSIIDIYSYRVASQIYEGLFKFDQRNLEVIPSLVEDYSVSEDQTTYTFKLKDEIYFHDDACFPNGKGKKLSAEDVKYCFTLSCSKSKNNQSSNLFVGLVKGAKEYYEASSTNSEAEQTVPEVSGIKVIDNLTLEITLEEPNSMFLYNLARPGAFIFPKEAYQLYGEEMRTKCVGTGPFKLASVDEDISIILKKNENYHGTDMYGNKLPFLDAIVITFVKDKKIEMLQFKKHELDMMYRIPTEYIINVLEESSDANANKQYELQRVPEMSTQCLAFNNSSKVFKDVNVRKAFSFAIDRERILDYILNGEGYKEGIHGITPPVFNKYDITKIKGYSFNIDSAKIYLSKAGYPNGKGFPTVTLDLNTEGEQYSNVALEVKKQLESHLNINIDLKISPFAQIVEKSTSGNYEFLRLAWIADYPSPENYLWAYHSKSLPENPDEKSYPNLTRYKNPLFDKYYEQAMAAKSTDEAFENFMKAEKVLMQDAPFLVLWYDEGYRLIQSYVKDFPNNPMQYRDFSTVYFSNEKDFMAQAE
ncbi:ABC transporter substrate-binding protein [Limibacter armeniacum]|uniref:ABC transporter substrate-binding protein n=1 Tax=Limibacter armeniacum TaxID=466084 RepID=UPI002FE55A58